MKKPVQELISINHLGNQVLAPCAHPKIPGLDADFCRSCQIWYVNQQLRDRVLNRWVSVEST